MDLLFQNQKGLAPLADRMRPRSLEEFYGQNHLLGEGKLLRRAIIADRLSSSIFYGPPGSGKTTLAQIIANSTKMAFYQVNAVSSGVNEVRQIIAEVEKNQRLYGKAAYILMDECHRWSKAQSDSILPAIEQGIIRFIGSTTENPMIAMTPAMVSRCRLFRFESLRKTEIIQVINQALSDTQRGYGNLCIQIDDDAVGHIADMAGGDARAALNAVELAVLTTNPDVNGLIHITLEIAEESIQKKRVRCDDEEFYQMLSAFCKSLRGSDSDAALFWCGRMLYAGVDPRIIVRRMIIHSSEDIGMANPLAMQQAVSALHALQEVGMPEARLNIAQAIIYLCESPKSDSVIKAVDYAFFDAEHVEQAEVPLHLRDTHYKGAAQLGEGAGYQYPHDYPSHYVVQQYMPDTLIGKRYYQPTNQGSEARIAKAKHNRQEMGMKNAGHQEEDLNG